MSNPFAHQTAEEYAEQIPIQKTGTHGRDFRRIPMGIYCVDCNQGYTATNDYEQDRLAVGVLHLLSTGSRKKMLCIDCLAKRG